jgi:hypothetical protein
MKSSQTEAAKEFVTEERVDRAAAEIADAKRPVSPGTVARTWKLEIISILGIIQLYLIPL